MAKESQIRATFEEYLNLETSLSDYAAAKDEALKRYNHLLEHKPGNNVYDLHIAAPIVGCYEEIKDLDRKSEDAHHKLNLLSEKIKGYIDALKGGSLYVRFSFDELDHRAGVHTFYIENNELKTHHSPLI